MRIRNYGNQLGMIGRIKVGMTNEKGLPISLDYFRFVSPYEDTLRRMRELFGEKPNSLPITFFSDDPSVSCAHFYELRNKAGQLVAVGDGRIFYRSTEHGVVEDNADDEKWKGQYMQGLARKYSEGNFQADWVERLKMKFLIIGCKEFGYWEFNTGAIAASIPQIVSTFDNCLQHAGRVQFLPFRLVVTKHKGNRVHASGRIYPVVNLILDLNIEALEQIAQYGENIQGLITEQKLQKYLPGKSNEQNG
ncbi:MAG: hypothetical protein KatS3mg031_2900 [Chitinophagales bacterium]|nr:MAG: hypothetical protein KatS3mg031_2900 [Chitinophagales bacterium]